MASNSTTSLDAPLRLRSLIAALVPLLGCTAIWWRVAPNLSVQGATTDLGDTVFLTSLSSVGPFARLVLEGGVPVVVSADVAVWLAWLGIVALTPARRWHWAAHATVSGAWLLTGALVGANVGTAIT